MYDGKGDSPRHILQDQYERFRRKLSQETDFGSGDVTLL